MVVVFSQGVYMVTTAASGVDQGGQAVVVDVTAYAFDVDDAGIAVAMIETELLKEPIIPDGAGGSRRPQQITAVAVGPGPLAVSPLLFKRETSGANTKFPVNSIHEVQVIASLTSASVSTTLNVYVLNTSLSAAIALAKSDVQVMYIVPDPWGPPGQMTTPDKVTATSAKPVSSVVDPWKQIILKT